MKKLKLVAILPLLFFITSAIAQTKIVDNGIPTDSSALLELQSTTKGFLLTRVALTATNAIAPLTAPVAGMEVYNTATAGTTPYIVTPGVYYYNGSIWVREDGGNQWNLLGNAGTVDGTNFIGTTDNVPLTFRVNNIQSGRIETTLYSANTSFGYNALGIATGGGNAAFGWYALAANTSGTNNMALGAQALQGNTTGANNTAIGQAALEVCCTVGNDNNTAVGGSALFHNTGKNNVALGTSDLWSNVTGTNNTALGTGVDGSVSNLNYATGIGSGTVLTQSNTMILGGNVGSASAVSVGIGTNTPTSTLQILGPIATAIKTVTTSTTLDNTYSSVLVNGPMSITTITLPAASLCIGRVYQIKNISATSGHPVSIVSSGGNIDGATIKAINTAYEGVTVQSDGTNWWIIQ